MTDATIALKLDTKGLKAGQQEIDKLGRKGKEVETNLGKSTENLNNKWSTSTKAIAGVTSALVAMGAVKVFTNAIKTTAEFSQSIADLSAITGATGKDLEFYSKQAAEIGRTTSLSASQAATAFKLIASAKPDLLDNAEALNAVTRSAVTLAEATGQDLPTAASALGSALNQFGLDASKADEVINVLAASSKLGTAEVGAVSEALKNAGPAANALGIDLTETVAAIQALAKSGRQGADAGTGLRQMMLALEKTGDKLLRPSLVGIGGALDELAKRNLSVNDLMGELGVDAATVTAAMIEQRGTVTELNTELRDTDTAYEQAAARMDTFVGDLKDLGSAIEGLQIAAMGASVDDLGRSAVQTATGGINLLTENLDHVGSAAKVLATILTVRMIPALVQTATRMAAAAISATQLGGALTLLGGPVGIAALAAGSVVALAMAFKSLREEQERARKSALDFIDTNYGVAGIDLTIKATLTELETLNKTLDRVKANMADPHAAGEFQKLTKKQNELVAELNELSIRRIKLDSEVIESTEKYTGAVDTLTGAMIPFNMETIVANEQLVDMGVILSRLEKGEFTAVKKVVADTTFRMQGMITTTDELTSSIGETETATGTLATKTTTSTRSMETDLGRLGNTAVDTFAQMLVSGGDAMDGLKRVFENAIADMVSKFFKSGLANIFSGGGFGGSSGGGSSASLLSGGSNLLGLAGLGGSVGGFLSGVFGTATGVAANTVGPPTAAAMAGSGMMSSIGAFITSPVGIAAGALLAGKLIHDMTSNPDGYIRSSAGFLTAPTAGAKPGQTFAVDPFASGFNPIGFSDKKSREEAIASINVFRDLDKTITDLVVGAGGFVDLSKATLGGFGQDGVAGTSGTFLGLGGKTTEADLAAMADSYAIQLANHIQGLSAESMAQLMGATSASEVASILSGLAEETNRAAETTETASDSISDAAQQYADSTTDLISSNAALAVSIASSASSLATGLATASQPPTPAGIGGGMPLTVIGAADSSHLNLPAWASGLSDAARNALAGMGINGSHASGLNSVPFDGYVAELHKGERVKTASEARQEDSMASMMGDLKVQIVKNTQLMLSIVQRWDFDGLPATRT